MIVGDVRMAAGRDEALRAIRLVMLVNDVSLRNLIPAELAKGFGFFHGKPSSAFSPVAVTPDELGHAFDGGKVALPLLSYVNGALFGKPNAGIDMTFDFPTLIAHAAKTRPLSAGTIVGSGTVSNKDKGGGPGLPIVEGSIAKLFVTEALWRAATDLLDAAGAEGVLQHGALAAIASRRGRALCHVVPVQAQS